MLVATYFGTKREKVVRDRERERERERENSYSDDHKSNLWSGQN